MKVMKKYFLAIVPGGEIQKAATALKLEIKERFNVKYALKSPAHVTLKMPFSYNETKESILLGKLSAFVASRESFEIQVKETDTFGRRVIFWSIESGSKLFELQEDLKLFCKKELNLVDELSDRNYHPHMTIAFKDLKEKNFEEVLELVKENEINTDYTVNHLAILKRNEGRWEVHRQFELAQADKMH